MIVRAFERVLDALERAGLSAKGSTLIATGLILGVWALVGILAVDGEVHPMGVVCTLAGAWSACVVYYRLVMRWVR
jgi:hypothetical protein